MHGQDRCCRIPEMDKIMVAKKVMVVKEMGPDALGLLERKKRPLTGQKRIYLSHKSLSRCGSLCCGKLGDLGFLCHSRAFPSPAWPRWLTNVSIFQEIRWREGWERDSHPTSHFCPKVGDFPGHETFNAQIRKVPDRQGVGVVVTLVLGPHLKVVCFTCSCIPFART